MNLLRWLTSPQARTAADSCRQIAARARAQSDLLPTEQRTRLNQAVASARQALDGPPESLAVALQDLHACAEATLPPVPNPGRRENIELLLVGLTLALAIRTFFFQPFKIPTGSMQPTLNGIRVENLAESPDKPIPAWPQRWFEALVFGVTYHQAIAQADGPIDLPSIEPPRTVFPFIQRQQFRLGGVTHTLWFPPAGLGANSGTAPHLALFALGKVQPGRPYRRGDLLFRLKVTRGDHLFVDRFTYNFRRPTRGEIIVFETAGISHPALPQDQYYIKRLVAMGGETVRIGPDRHLVIDGTRLDAGTHRFENVYGFNPSDPPAEDRFSGHVLLPGHSTAFESKPEGVVVRPGHFMVMGDNTMNSLDSREWGDFSRTNTIGKSGFVYWPISSRFGWGNR